MAACKALMLLSFWDRWTCPCLASAKAGKLFLTRTQRQDG